MSIEIDLRSDAVTRPSEAMWAAMRADGLAWSRLGDPTVRALEERAALLMGTDNAVFAPTGTMANTLALLALARPGDRFLVDRRAHVVTSEDRSFARLAGLYPELLIGDRGHLLAGDVAAALEARHLDSIARTPLVWLENTHTAAGGTVAKPHDIAAVAAAASGRGAAVHLDGARLFNAAIAMGVPPAIFIPPGTSVTVNLNKGLGAPAGALVCGPHALVAEMRSRLLGLGGVLANAGLIAAAGLVALEEASISRLAEDNARAGALAAALSGLPEFVTSSPDTNIIFVQLPAGLAAEEARVFLEKQGVLVLAFGGRTIRLVTHRHVEAGHESYVVDAFAGLLKRVPRDREAR